jgi:hypothetical protein
VFISIVLKSLYFVTKSVSRLFLVLLFIYVITDWG